MFQKLVSGLPFSPALVGQLGFYARRLKKEEASRRLGLIFTALALVVQSFAVFSPPDPANAASSNDLIYGGVTSVAQILTAYDNPATGYKKLMDYNGITRSEIAATVSTTINSRDYGTGSNAWISWGHNPRFSTELGEVMHNIDGSVFYSRPLWRFDSTSWTLTNGSTHNVFKGTSAKLGVFAIMKNCGNLAATKLPTPPPPPPPVVIPPTATCTVLDAIKIDRDKYRFTMGSSVANGATISGYTITVKNSSGAVVKTINESSTNSSFESQTVHTFSPGSYTASSTVNTSLGPITSDSCVDQFVVEEAPVVTNPSVTITKKVDGVEQKTVAIGQEFKYQIVAKNTGDIALSNVTVSDNAPAGVTFVSATLGSIANNKWSYTVANLPVGQSITVSITAKVPAYAAGFIKNTACVDTPTISATNPDSCDDATVDVPVPMIEVCNLTTLALETIKETDFNPTRHSKDPNDCKRIQVCDLTSDIVITIREVDFDSTKQSKDTAECDKMQVCDLTTGAITTIPKNNFDSTKYSKDAYDCQSKLVNEKSATNLTQESDATKVIAKAGDRIQYTLSVTNTGKIDASIDFQENMADTLEYSALNDNGGGSLTEVLVNGYPTKVLTWGKVTLKPGEKVSRTFTVKVLDTIPLTPQGISEPGSYDCIMTNTFGNTVGITVDCQAPKVLEAVIKQLPSTGPTENMIFAGLLATIVVYFYSRSRQLGGEIRLIRKDFNAGTL
jgi:uncharacterized repeat protein (TIGR01451 family)